MYYIEYDDRGDISPSTLQCWIEARVIKNNAWVIVNNDLGVPSEGIW